VVEQVEISSDSDTEELM